LTHAADKIGVGDASFAPGTASKKFKALFGFPQPGTSFPTPVISRAPSPSP